jgi:hypothetical protein
MKRKGRKIIEPFRTLHCHRWLITAIILFFFLSLYISSILKVITNIQAKSPLSDNEISEQLNAIFIDASTAFDQKDYNKAIIYNEMILSSINSYNSINRSNETEIYRLIKNRSEIQILTAEYLQLR